jgi:hypothetical protein
VAKKDLESMSEEQLYSIIKQQLDFMLKEELDSMKNAHEIQSLLGLTFGNHLIDFILELSGLKVFNESELKAQGIAVDAIREYTPAEMLQCYNISPPDSPKPSQTENKINKSTSFDNTLDKNWRSMRSEMLRVLTTTPELKQNLHALSLALFIAIESGNKTKINEILSELSKDERIKIMLMPLRTGDPIEPVRITPLIFAAINSMVSPGHKEIASILLNTCKGLLLNDQSIAYVEQFLKEKSPTERQINTLLENTVSLNSTGTSSPADISDSPDNSENNSASSSPSVSPLRKTLTTTKSSDGSLNRYVTSGIKNNGPSSSFTTLPDGQQMKSNNNSVDYSAPNVKL